MRLVKSTAPVAATYTTRSAAKLSAFNAIGDPTNNQTKCLLTQNGRRQFKIGEKKENKKKKITRHIV